ncbi:MAG: tripartite tricarboxylate transporter permease [Candidatus Thermoplasmatota archaeon]
MSELGLLASVAASAAAGSALGFATGLVPGLHVNNIAAAAVAYAGSFLGLFALLGGATGSGEAGLMLSCFLVSALVSHGFSEAVPNTYVGIPSGDAITVLPAHRLAKAGLGWAAVRSSIDGSLAGVLLGAAALVPISVILGPAVGAYALLRGVMGLLILLLSSVLVLSDGLAVPAARHRNAARAARMAKILAVFLASGTLGFVVLDTNYFAAVMPGCQAPFVPRSSLLLPLFAGLFGMPTLMLSLGSAGSRDPGATLARKVREPSRLRGSAMSLVGGVLVGWIPGLTSGSSATICSSALRGPAEEAGDVEGSMRFIWLYSAISSAGAVLSVGALFTILRSRSGVMDAVSRFISPEPVGQSLPDLVAPSALLLSMVLSALLSYSAMSVMRERLRAVGRALCSRKLAIGAAVFVVSLVAALTGLRGLLLLATACCLGVLPPLIGVRRIHLMGCLLVPISVTFL